MAKTVMGTCRLCGSYKKLSKEHVPPSAAFNSGDYTLESIDMFKTKNVDVWRKQKRQGGHFTYVFCEQCNNRTGHWYGGEYAKIAKTCAPYAQTANAGMIGPINLEQLFPSRVFKQALSIMCAMADPSPSETWSFIQAPSNTDLGLAKLDRDLSKATEYLPELRKFVLDKEAVGLSVPVRLYTYLVCDLKGRTTGVGKMWDKNTGASLLYCEFSWWPIGWVLVFDGDLNKMPLLDVTDWSKYGYDDDVSVTLNVPCLWVEGRMPLNFKSPDEMEVLRAKNQAAIDTWERMKTIKNYDS